VCLFLVVMIIEPFSPPPWTSRLSLDLDRPVGVTPDVLLQAEGVPFFAFLDPYGIGLSFELIVNNIFARPHVRYSPATEMLMNFSADMVRRIGGRLKEEPGSQGRETTLARMDAVCGGDWWRLISRESATAEEASGRIAREYFARLSAATRATGWVVEVRNAGNQQPRYSLVFLTRHRDGFFVFGDVASSAQRDWRRATVEIGSLFDDDVFFEAEEDALARGWIKEIKSNIMNLLASNTRVVAGQSYIAVMGSALGLARTTHVRTAIRELFKEGRVSLAPGKGDTLWSQPIERASARV
jgi:hypothetical protein